MRREKRSQPEGMKIAAKRLGRRSAVVRRRFPAICACGSVRHSFGVRGGKHSLRKTAQAITCVRCLAGPVRPDGLRGSLDRITQGSLFVVTAQPWDEKWRRWKRTSVATEKGRGRMPHTQGRETETLPTIFGSGVGASKFCVTPRTGPALGQSRARSRSLTGPEVRIAKHSAGSSFAHEKPDGSKRA